MQSSENTTTGQVIKCKASVAFKAQKPLQHIDILVAPPKKREVRVKVIANALCHTDVYTLDGCDPEGKFPCILGHEATAIVESVGEDVTDYQPGDVVVPCYTPMCMEWDCIFCKSDQTNLCPKVRATQGQGLMPDGTSRFSTLDGQIIYHFMGCSTFSEYTVLNDISLAKINPLANPYEACLLGCGVSTGWGAVLNNPNFKSQCSVAIWGLGAVGLSVIQAAKLKGANRIYGIDINEDKFTIAKEFGCTDCFNPLKGNAKDFLISKEKWGIDFTFDCTGNVQVMRDALESAHRGFGESTVIGVAASGKELATRPFQLITGRVWKGTAFGGWKSRMDVPKLVNKVLLNELPISKYITHNYEGLDKVQELVDTLHVGNCLRGIVKISPYDFKEAPKIEVIESTKIHGGVHKVVQHWSEVNQCTMKFAIFLPDDDVKAQRGHAYPVLYFLSGLTCTHENVPTKTNYAEHCKRHNIAMVFPDTSPRNCGAEEGDWTVGYGAGHYCNATQEPWNKNFNMYDYVTKELPKTVETFFPVNPKSKSITGFSMGGGGALMIAARNPGVFRSVSALAPISNPTVSEGFAKKALGKYFANIDEAKQYDTVEVINAAGKNLKMPPTLIDFASQDKWIADLAPQSLERALGESGSGINIRWQEGYSHNMQFVTTFIREHIDFHASKLN